ncbi:transposase [Okeania sp. KiyG1]|uniref:transposase n=1 Tax=Okeania sp. KiyG1 TaxID=2720165 RepID=UPI00192254A9|nr:transposase [Okeania sp. KiyG1]GGA35952.1 hypothetical protein CYANOKiyG1_53670 [Okeania sp. KiyG1]
MSRATTPSFITELPLKVSSQQNRELEARFNAAMRLYNACLNEAKVRMELVKNSSAYQQAKSLPLFVTRNNKQLANPERKQLFNEARKQYRFSDFGLQAFATLTANRAKWIAEKIDSNTQQKLATRAFNAVEKVLFNKAKKVRFKITTRFRSIEGKSNKQGLRWKSSLVVWGKLKLLPIIPKNNPVIEHGLNSKVKYVRLVWRELNGKKRWFVQLICEGQPYEKPQNYVSSGTIGLDLNISNVAIVADDYAGLLPLADKVPTYQKEIRQLQRKMERSRRANNPDKYESNFQKRVGRKIVTKKGQLKKGQQTKWCHSKHYYKTAIKKRELERKKAAYTKSQNRRLVNDILRHGSTIKTENVSVKAWQKIWGKAISNKSPGFFISELHRKAENAGGQFIKFSTQKTALSQTHLTGNRVKKTLSQRVHTDETGVVMHRDLFSAFLARHINEDELSLHDALQEYQRLEPVLQEAWEHYQINCKQVSLSESRSAHSPSEQFSCYLKKLSTR